MNKLKLQQWLPVLLILVISSCSHKELPGNNATVTEDRFENAKSKEPKYVPLPVISIADELAKSTKDGEMYYDDKEGYRYWRQSDGKYYLDEKYIAGASPNKKLVKKMAKQQRKENNDSYTHQ